MKNALILHGTDATPEAHWFRWLETTMRNRGYAVWLPQLPSAAAPDADTYNRFLLGNGDFRFGPETMLAGHSSGAVAILSLLQHLPAGVTVGDIYLVSAFRNDLGWEALRGLFAEPYKYDLIRTRTRSITLIHADNDPYVPLEQAEFLAGKLGARLIVMPGQGHFNLEQSPKYEAFPLLLQIIETQDILRPPHRLHSFRGQAVTFATTQAIKAGLECDVYSFVDDTDKDLGILRISQGVQSSRQKILRGRKTVEGFLHGKARLTVWSGSDRTEHMFADISYVPGIELAVGDVMQWTAEEDTIGYEICYPPYDDGRFLHV